MKRNSRQLGFTLLEVLISLGILSTVMVGLANLSDQYAKETIISINASQSRTFADASRDYIKDNYAGIMVAATPTVPVKIDTAMLIAAGKLPSGYVGTNAYGQTLCTLVLEPIANRLQGLVVAEGGQTVDDVSLGSLAGIVGGSGGGVYSTASTVVRGAVGGWSIPVSTYDNLVNNVGTTCAGVAGNVRLAVGRPVVALWFENGDTTSAFLSRDAVPGRPELNQMNTPIVMNSVQTANLACTLTGSIARDATGAVLSCQSGSWKSQGSAYWQDPAATFATLPICSATTSGQTRIVTTPTVGSGPRSYTCNGTTWTALAVDNSGNITIPGIATTGKVQLNDVAVAGVACATTGLVSRDASGGVLSCQSGVWKGSSAGKFNDACASAGGPSYVLSGACEAPIVYACTNGTISVAGYGGSCF